MQKVPTGKNYNNYINIKNMKAIYPQTLNLKNKRVINLHSPKNDFFHLDNNKIVNNKENITINTNFMASTFNKINKFNSKKIKIPIKNEFNTLKNIRNNSITIIKVEKDDSKSSSINKNKITGERNKNDNNLNKTGNKVKTFNKLLSSNPQYISPISYKGSRNNGKMLNKYIKRDINKNIMNNFTQKHRANSNKH